MKAFAQLAAKGARVPQRLKPQFYWVIGTTEVVPHPKAAFNNTKS